MLVGTTDNYLSLLFLIREMALFGIGDQVHKSLRNASICIITRNWGNGVAFGSDKEESLRWLSSVQIGDYDTI